MKLIHSIRFKLLFSIFIVIAIFLPLLVWLAANFGASQLATTLGHEEKGRPYLVGGSVESILNNTKSWATILAHLTFGSLRESMAKYDVDAMTKIVQMARAQKDVTAVRIFGPKLGPKMKGEIRFNGDSPEHPKEAEALDCGACHTSSGTLLGKPSQEAVPFVDAQVRIDGRYNTDMKGNHNLEMIVHVYNQQDPCWQCHKPTQKVNGVIQVNVSLKHMDDLVADLQSKVQKNEQRYREQVVSVGLLFAALILVILLWIATGIVNRLGKLRYVAERMSMGETDVTLDDVPPSLDEIGELRNSFERMLVAVRFFMMPEQEPEENQ